MITRRGLFSSLFGSLALVAAALVPPKEIEIPVILCVGEHRDLLGFACQDENGRVYIRKPSDLEKHKIAHDFPSVYGKTIEANLRSTK